MVENELDIHLVHLSVCEGLDVGNELVRIQRTCDSGCAVVCRLRSLFKH